MLLVFGSAPQRYVGVDLARWPVHRVLIGFLVNRVIHANPDRKRIQTRQGIGYFIAYSFGPTGQNFFSISPAEIMPPRNIAVRLTASFETLRTTVSDWSMVCKYLICYEHPEENNVHCHLLLTGVYCSDQHLKDVMRDHGVSLKGAGQLSFKATYKDQTLDRKVDITDETTPKYITYMSKGKYDPKYNKGFIESDIERYKSLWVDFTREPPSYLIYKEFTSKHPDLPNKSEVLHAAHAYCMIKYKSHTRQCRNEISTLIDDYCYYHGIDKQYQLPCQQYK